MLEYLHQVNKRRQEEEGERMYKDEGFRALRQCLQVMVSPRKLHVKVRNLRESEG